MGTIYPRGHKLWIGYKGTTGKRRYAPTEYRVGQEKQAKKVLDAVEARTAAEVAFGGRTGRRRSSGTCKRGSRIGESAVFLT